MREIISAEFQFPTYIITIPQRLGRTDGLTDGQLALAVGNTALRGRNANCCKPANRDRMHQFCAAAKRMSSRCQMDNHEIFDTAYRPEFSHVLYLLLTKHYQLSSCKH